MNKKIKQLKLNNLTYLIMFFSIFILAFLSYILISEGRNNEKTTSVTYNTDSNINYKVYLKKNNFFTEPYLDMNKTYIASLIDHVDVLFNYNLKYSEIVSGKYEYYIKSTILANKEGSDETNYWSKSYNLTEPEIIEFNEQDNFNITTNVKIDYQKYSNLLKKFRKEYGLSIDGILKIELIINSVSNYAGMKKNIELNSTAEMNIPLTEQAIEFSIEHNEINDSGKVEETIKIKEIKYIILQIIGYLLWTIGLIFSLIIIYNAYLEFKNRSEYSKKLKKIFSTYDSIIVTTQSMPSLDKMKIINVNSFQELIDAHSEVRMPINYIEKEKGLRSDFLLISNNMVWLYILKHENYEKLKRK